MSRFIACSYCTSNHHTPHTSPTTGKFLKVVAKQLHTLFLRPAAQSTYLNFLPLHLSHTDVGESHHSFLEKGGSRVAPSLDCMAGVVNLSCLRGGSRGLRDLELCLAPVKFSCAAQLFFVVVSKF
jgi:hypothetical protein